MAEIGRILQNWQKLAEFCRIGRNWQNFAELAEFGKIGRIGQNLAEFGRIWQNQGRRRRRRRGRRRGRRRRRKKFPICVKLKVINSFGAVAQKELRNIPKLKLL